MDTNKRVFGELPVNKAVRMMAIPTVVGQLIILIYNIADTFFIGRTNDPAMVAGASLILPVFNISLSIAGIAGVGGGALISRLLGEKRPDEARKAYSFSIYVSLFAAAAKDITRSSSASCAGWCSISRCCISSTRFWA